MKPRITQNGIPNKWKQVTLGKLFEFRNGVNSEKKNYGSGIRFINIMEILRYDFLDAEKIPGRITIGKKEAEKNLVRYGDVLFNRTSETPEEVGMTSVYLDTEPVVFGGFVIRGRPINKDLDDGFKKYCFSTQFVRREVIRRGQGAVRGNIGQGDLEKVLFLLPPISEQKRIVTVLETWDQVIDKLSRKIEIKKKIKGGLMQDLLTGKKRLPGFKEKWKSFEFGDIASPKRERFDPRETLENRFCVELEHIESGSGRLLDHGYTKDSLSLKTVFGPGDVLFGKLRAYLRKYWFATNDGVCSTEIWVLEANKTKILPAILFQIVQSERFISVAATSQGTHMPRSNWDVVAEYEVQLPTIVEQKAIADILTTADKEISHLERKLSLLGDQKKYLLNTLITGTIRVV